MAVAIYLQHKECHKPYCYSFVNTSFPTLPWNSQQLILTLSSVQCELNQCELKQKGRQGLFGSFILWIPAVLSVKIRNLVQPVTIGISQVCFSASLGIEACRLQAENPLSRLALNTIKTIQEEVGRGEQKFACLCGCTTKVTGIHYTNLFLYTGD